MSQITEIEQLKRENEELRASNQSIRESVDVIHAISDELQCLYRDLLGSEDVSDDLYEAKERIEKLCRTSLNKTPSQHLADVKADAVLSVINSINPRGEVAGGDDAYSGEDIQEYAENLRGKTK